MKKEHAGQGQGQGQGRNGVGAVRQRARDISNAVGGRVRRHTTALWCAVRTKAACKCGQGTTEYAILVGVLVVIAIVAITVFRPKVQELWDAIATGINSL